MEVITADRLLDAQQGAPLITELAALFPGGQLPRGRAIGCGGGAHRLSSVRTAHGWWLALALSRQLMVEGAWAAAVDVANVGVEAAATLGIPIERMVRVDTGSVDPTRWADAVVAAIDGFEIVITQPPAHSERLWRKVQQRIQARRVVALVFGSHVTGQQQIGTDFDIDFNANQWVGVGNGHGHLAERQVTITVSGRRMPRSRTVDVVLPNAVGSLSLPSGAEVTEVDGQIERADPRPEVALLQHVG